jgi:hypothetical protein
MLFLIWESLQTFVRKNYSYSLNMLFFITILFLSSCQENGLPPEQYVEAVRNEEYGLKVEKKGKHFTYILQYQPTEYQALRNLNTFSPEPKAFKASMKEKSKYQSYTLTIHPNGSQSLLDFDNPSEEAYKERVKYYSFEMKNDAVLIDGKDTLNCIGYHFERTYNAKPGKQFLMKFKNSKGLYQNKKLRLKNPHLPTDEVLLTINGNNLKEFPKLKTSDHGLY